MFLEAQPTMGCVLAMGIQWGHKTYQALLFKEQRQTIETEVQTAGQVVLAATETPGRAKGMLF